MPKKALNKHQLRTQETQARLLAAAEAVFARDGYEKAQLDEIAAAAGRTKGAVYAHFKSKEDLFLAIFEHRTLEYVGDFRRKIEKCGNRKDILQVFRDFYVGVAHEKTWAILVLEFKLFSLRHPRSKQRLKKTSEMTMPIDDPDFLHQVFGNLTREQKSDVNLSILALGPIISGLILESHFEPARLSDKALARLLGRVFDALFSAAGA